MTELPQREDFGDYGAWPGRAVLDPTGRHLGEVREIYLDDATDRPEWVLVEMGGEDARFVPLADASIADDAITVAQEGDRVEAAPTLEPSKELTQEQERRLYSHYGLRYSEDESDSLLPDPDQPSAGADDEPATAAAVLPASPPDDGEGERPRPEAVAAPGAPEATPPETPAGESAGAEDAGAVADAAPRPAASASAAARPRLRRYVGAVPELPAPGDTSEPADTGPMVPPRPEPVAPSPTPEPEPGGPLGFVRKRPVPVAAGVVGAVAAIAYVLLRRR